MTIPGVFPAIDIKKIANAINNINHYYHKPGFPLEARFVIIQYLHNKGFDQEAVKPINEIIPDDEFAIDVIEEVLNNIRPLCNIATNFRWACDNTISSFNKKLKTIEAKTRRHSEPRDFKRLKL